VKHLGERLSALIDGELKPAQREQVLIHLARCDACRGEAVALRAVKQRLRALGEATVAMGLSDRLLSLVAGAGAGGAARRPFLARHRGAAIARRRPVWVAALAAAAALGLAVPAAGFLAGGQRQAPDPSVTPAVDMFLVQHAITTGQAPAAPAASATAVTRPLAPVSRSASAAPRAVPASARAVAPATGTVSATPRARATAASAGWLSGSLARAVSPPRSAPAFRSPGAVRGAGPWGLAPGAP
jgi:hypothetical protein